MSPKLGKSKKILIFLRILSDISSVIKEGSKVYPLSHSTVHLGQKNENSVKVTPFSNT